MPFLSAVVTLEIPVRRVGFVASLASFLVLASAVSSFVAKLASAVTQSLEILLESRHCHMFLTSCLLFVLHLPLVVGSDLLLHVDEIWVPKVHGMQGGCQLTVLGG